MKHTITILALLGVLASCGDSESNMEDSSLVYEQAAANKGRTEADQARDAGRQPAKVLEFFGIQPGMTVLDMFSGGGYYTEMLSHIVGPEGGVIAHSNQVYAGFVGEETKNRYANKRLANVEILMAENNELDLPDASFDAIMMVLAYHDIYYIDPDNGWPEIDGPRLVETLYSGLRPGGILAVVDHYAAPGSPSETGNTLHRIDPDIVVTELEAAGFVLEEKSDVLRNMDDDHSLNMGNPEVRGKTDRFVFRFRKPE